MKKLFVLPVVLLLASGALAARNTAGVYSLPAGNPVVSGTTITSTWANGTLSDIKGEITNSLSRDGYGAMRAPLKVPSGSAPQPALTFTSDAASGLYLNATSDVRMCAASTDIMKWSTTEVRSYKNFVSEGSVTAATGLTVTAGGATVTAGNLAVNSGAATVSGSITTSAGGNTLMLKPGSADHTYLSFYARTASPSTRSGYIGFAGPADTFISIANEVSGGVVKMTGGTAATGAAPTNVLELTNGNLKLSGTAPNSSVAVSNTLTPANIVKAHCLILATSSNVQTVTDGFNVASVTAVSGGASKYLRVTLATAMANTTYTVIVSTDTAGSVYVVPLSRTTTTFDITLRDTSGAQVDVTTTSHEYYVMVLGRQ